MKVSPASGEEPPSGNGDATTPVHRFSDNELQVAGATDKEQPAATNGNKLTVVATGAEVTPDKDTSKKSAEEWPKLAQQRVGQKTAGGRQLVGSQTKAELFMSSEESMRGKKRYQTYMWTLALAKTDWKKDRGKVWVQTVRANQIAAVFGITGTITCVLQNEICIRGGDPKSLGMNVLKAINLITTIITMLALVRMRWLLLLMQRLTDHINKGLALDTRVQYWQVLTHKILIAELIFMLIGVLPPGMTYELSTATLSNVIVYRGETLTCVVSTFRIYLLWRCIRDAALNSIPKRHSVAEYTDVRLNSSYVIKRLLNQWRAIFYVCATWAFLILVITYWYRSAEITACLFEYTEHEVCEQENAKIWSLRDGEEFLKVNDEYLWNHFWGIFIVATKGNNGSFTPTTHMGRFASGIAAILSILMTSLLTAGLGHAMQCNPREQSANALITREKARAQLVPMAVSLISMWWRKSRGKRLTQAQKHVRRSDLLKQFIFTKRIADMEIDDLLGPNDKIDKISGRAKRMEFAIFTLATQFGCQEVLEYYAEHAGHAARPAWAAVADEKDSAELPSSPVAQEPTEIARRTLSSDGFKKIPTYQSNSGKLNESADSNFGSNQPNALESSARRDSLPMRQHGSGDTAQTTETVPLEGNGAVLQRLAALENDQKELTKNVDLILQTIKRIDAKLEDRSLQL